MYFTCDGFCDLSLRLKNGGSLVLQPKLEIISAVSLTGNTSIVAWRPFQTSLRRPQRRIGAMFLKNGERKELSNVIQVHSITDAPPSQGSGGFLTCNLIVPCGRLCKRGRTICQTIFRRGSWSHFHHYAAVKQEVTDLPMLCSIYIEVTWFLFRHLNVATRCRCLLPRSLQQTLQTS